MGDTVFCGILEGFRIIHDVKFVVLKRGSGALLMSPFDFPSEAWINERLGKTVYVVVNDDKVQSVKEGIHPDTVINVTIADDRVAVTCTVCEEVVCYGPKPEQASLESMYEAMHPFVEHLKAKHPNLMQEILRSL